MSHMVYESQGSLFRAIGRTALTIFHLTATRQRIGRNRVEPL